MSGRLRAFIFSFQTKLVLALTSVILLLQPVASVGLSAAVLDERPSPLQLLGCGIVLAGVVAATAGRRDRAPRPAPADEVPSWT